MLTTLTLTVALLAQPSSETPIRDAIHAMPVEAVAIAEPRPHRAHGLGFRALMVANVAIMGADVGGTMAAVQTGKVTEINPVFRWVVHRDPIVGGAVNGAATAIHLSLIDRVAQKHPKLANVLLGVNAALRGYVAFVNNRRVYRQVKGRR